MFQRAKDLQIDDFDISYGGWIPPSSCSMLINIVQFVLTYYSLYLYKGDPMAYWQPNQIRSELSSFN